MAFKNRNIVITMNNNTTPITREPKFTARSVSIAEKVKMSVLITGASGFVGRAMCERMLVDGWQVRGIVRSAEQTAGLSAGVEAVQLESIGGDAKTRLVHADRGQKVKQISFICLSSLFFERVRHEI